jgi:hypothetical protein
VGRVGTCGDNVAMESFFSLPAEERPEQKTVANLSSALARDRDRIEWTATGGAVSADSVASSRSSSS